MDVTLKHIVASAGLMAVLALLILGVACGSEPAEPTAAPAPSDTAVPQPTAQQAPTTAPSTPVPPTETPAPQAGESTPEVGNAVGNLAPDFTLRLLDGSELTSAQLREEGRPRIPLLPHRLVTDLPRRVTAPEQHLPRVCRQGRVLRDRHRPVGDSRRAGGPEGTRGVRLRHRLPGGQGHRRPTYPQAVEQDSHSRRRRHRVPRRIRRWGHGRVGTDPERPGRHQDGASVRPSGRTHAGRGRCAHGHGHRSSPADAYARPAADRHTCAHLHGNAYSNSGCIRYQVRSRWPRPQLLGFRHVVGSAGLLQGRWRARDGSARVGQRSRWNCLRDFAGCTCAGSDGNAGACSDRHARARSDCYAGACSDRHADACADSNTDAASYGYADACADCYADAAPYGDTDARAYGDARAAGGCGYRGGQSCIGVRAQARGRD